MYKQLLRVARQWRDLMNRMEQGLGHQSEESAPDGSMAIFCPACPQPGVNLPDDWNTRYQAYVTSPDSSCTAPINKSSSHRNELVRTFIMDGNFSAEHMRHRSGERDVALSAGMAFMANPESYKAHLRSGREIAQVCTTFMPDHPG